MASTTLEFIFRMQIEGRTFRYYQNLAEDMSIMDAFKRFDVLESDTIKGFPHIGVVSFFHSEFGIADPFAVKIRNFPPSSVIDVKWDFDVSAAAEAGHPVVINAPPTGIDILTIS